MNEKPIARRNTELRKDGKITRPRVAISMCGEWIKAGKLKPTVLVSGTERRPA